MTSKGTLSARHDTGNKLINIRKSALPEPCDAVYRVAGNGMAPIIRDGDLILVAFEKHLEPGAIGVFLCNGQIVIRQYYPEGLRSFRPELESVHLPEDSEYAVIGRFVAVITEDMLADEHEKEVWAKMKAMH